MIKNIALGLCILLLSSLPLQAETKNRKLIEDVLTNSGITKIIASIPSKSFEFMKRFEKNIPTENLNDVETMTRTSFETHKLYDMLVSHIEKNYNETYLKRLNEKYKSDLYKKITAIEENKSEVIKTEFPKFLSVFESNRPSPTRQDLINKLEEEGQIASESVKIMFSGVKAGILVQNQFLPNDDQVTMDTLAALKEKIYQEQYPEMKNFYLLLMIYYYDSVDDKTLEEYLSKVSEPEDRWLRQLLFRTTESFLETSTTDLTYKLIKKLKK